jgi:hypothetical protein
MRRIEKIVRSKADTMWLQDSRYDHHLQGGIMNRKAIAKILLIVSAVFCSSTIWAQVTTGTISGTVTDKGGAVVSGATVTIKELATGEQRTATTNGVGEYSFPALNPGSYEIRFTSAGFGPLLEHATLNVTERIRVDAMLPVQNATEQVIVTGEGPLLQTQDTTLGYVVGGAQISNLPLATRNFTQILALSPGVTASLFDATALGPGGPASGISANGARTGSNGYYIDGIDSTNTMTSETPNSANGPGLPIPSPDAIQEFKIQTGLYDATAGLNGGANVGLVTRSGTEQFHGTLFEFFRNDDLNANLYFFNKLGEARPELKQNQFGGTLGGPILKNKLFFFFSYQGTRQIDGVSGAKSFLEPAIPATRTAAALGAIFGGESGFYGGTAVAANGSNINPVSLAMLNYTFPNGSYMIPSPTTSATTGVNYAVSIPSTYTGDQFIDAVDYQLSSKDHISLKSMYSRDPEWVAFPSADVPGFGSPEYFSDTIGSLVETHVFSPTLVNVARAGVLHLGSLLGFQNEVPISSIGMSRYNSAVFPPYLPLLSVSGSFELGYSEDAYFGDQDTEYQYFDDLSWTHGNHQIQVGADARMYQNDYHDLNRFLGYMSIESFPDFLLGLSGNSVASGGNGSGYSNIYEADSGSGNMDRDDRIHDYAFYGADSWRVLPNLTVNYGLRWEYVGLNVDTGGRNGAFVPSLYVAPAPGTYTSAGFVQEGNTRTPIPGIPKVSNTLASPDLLNFGPRLGIAYQAKRWLNIRSGFGITVDRFSDEIGLYEELSTPNYERVTPSGTANINSTMANPFEALPLPSQFPVVPELWGGPTYAGATPAYSMNDLSLGLKVPYILQYGLDMQIQPAANTMVDIGYAGSRGVRELSLTYIDQAIIASPTNPVNGVTTTTTANVDDRVPYLGFAPNGLRLIQSNSNSMYNSLQASLTQRESHGLQMQVSYTYSKAEDTMSGSYSSGTTFGSWNGNQLNQNANWGPADYDRTHRLVVSGIYSVPGFSNSNAFEKKLFSGWQVSGVGLGQSGVPIEVTDSTGAAYYGTGESTASFAPGASAATAKLGGRTQSRLNEYFNPAAFVKAGNNYGNVGRNILRGPYEKNVDLALVKNIKLREPVNMEFRSEFFNALNITNFNNPGSNVSSSSSFGVITSQLGNPRVIQFALKFSF